MKIQSVFLVWLLFVVQLNAQQVSEKFYDYNWKETTASSAQFYSLVTKTDSGYLRKDYYIRERILQMKGLFEDADCKVANGSLTYLHSNGLISSFGNYLHGKKEGVWLSFHNNKMMSDSSTYLQGNQIGTCLSWHENGFPADSLVLDETGKGIEITYTNEGLPSSAGRYSVGKRQEGKWVYFHPNGNKSAIEIYHDNVLLNKQYFNESGILLNDSINNDRKAEFKGGLEAWTKWLTKRIYFPQNVKIVNTDIVAVVITFTINAQGKVESAFVSTPFEGDFNRIALNAIEQSPNWIPARLHNRSVPYQHRQIINFEQKDR